MACGDRNASSAASQYPYNSVTNRLVGARILPLCYDVQKQIQNLEPKDNPSTRPSKRLQPANVRNYRSVASLMIPVVHHQAVAIKSLLRKVLLVNPIGAPLRVVTIFLLQGNARRILLTWKNPLRPTTVASTKYDVCRDACCPRVNRTTASNLSTFHNTQIRNRENKK